MSIMSYLTVAYMHDSFNSCIVPMPHLDPWNLVALHLFYCNWLYDETVTYRYSGYPNS